MKTCLGTASQDRRDRPGGLHRHVIDEVCTTLVDTSMPAQKKKKEEGGLSSSEKRKKIYSSWGNV
jgi:hypothetical protein